MKTIDYYRALPYMRLIEPGTPDDGVRWIAVVAELPGCKADGDSYAEAAMNLDEAFDAYFDAKLAWKDEIPEPARKGTAFEIGGDTALVGLLLEWIDRVNELSPAGRRAGPELHRFPEPGADTTSVPRFDSDLISDRILSPR